MEQDLCLLRKLECLFSGPFDPPGTRELQKGVPIIDIHLNSLLQEGNGLIRLVLCQSYSCLIHKMHGSKVLRLACRLFLLRSRRGGLGIDGQILLTNNWRRSQDSALPRLSRLWRSRVALGNCWFLPGLRSWRRSVFLRNLHSPARNTPTEEKRYKNRHGNYPETTPQPLHLPFPLFPFLTPFPQSLQKAMGLTVLRALRRKESSILEGSVFIQRMMTSQ